MKMYYKGVLLPTKADLRRELGIRCQSFARTKPEKLLLYLLGLKKKAEVGEVVFSHLVENAAVVDGLSSVQSKKALLLLGMLYKSELDSKES